MSEALVVLSGGQDSTICLYNTMSWADKVHAITFDYGQRHRREIDAARTIASMAGVANHAVVDVSGILRGASPLINARTELETYQTFEQMQHVIGERVELTFVPMRNSLFLTIAANRAIALGCRDIVIGACQADSSNYPDCSLTFLETQQQVINTALGITDFKIHAPLLFVSKAESILLAQQLPGCMEALAYSHTCYAGEYPPCGKCHACVLRARGFQETGVIDPLAERAAHVRY